MAAAERAKKDHIQVEKELFEKALPDLRTAFMEMEGRYQRSWADQVGYATVGISTDLKRVVSSKEVENEMFRMVFNNSRSKKIGFGTALREQIIDWEAKRPEKRGPLGPRRKPKERVLRLEPRRRTAHARG